MDEVTLTLTLDQASWLYTLLFQVPTEYQNSKTEILKQKIEALPHRETD